MDTIELQRVVQDIEIALRPDNFLRWLGIQRPNDEYTGVEYAICAMVFASGEEDLTSYNADICNEDDDVDEYRLWDDSMPTCLENQFYGDDICIEQQGDYLIISEIGTHDLIAYIALPEWVIDLDKLSILQRTVNQLPLLYSQVQQYLLCRWGMDVDYPQQNVMEYWDY
jgi:hypothetical protein